MEGKDEGVCSTADAAGGFVTAATFCDVVMVIFEVGVASIVPSAAHSVKDFRVL